MQSQSKIVLLLALVCCGATLVVQARHTMLGKLGEEIPADLFLYAMVLREEPSITKQFPDGYKFIDLISYKKHKVPRVSGTNYFVKIKVTDNNNQEQYVHLRFFSDYGVPIELTSIRKDVDESIPLEYF